LTQATQDISIKFELKIELLHYFISEMAHTDNNDYVDLVTKAIDLSVVRVSGVWWWQGNIATMFKDPFVSYGTFLV